jgi:sugar lactone lactonase YvrE
VALATTVLAGGFVFTEGPRWRDGRLWFSDIHGHAVVATTPAGESEVMVKVDADDPSGLGWLPDGRLLIVGMERQQILRLETSGELVCHADLSSEARGSLNDMIVTNDGVAYVGDMGMKLWEDGPRRPGQTFCVWPDGSFTVAADELRSPNGHILSADESVLIVAESGGQRLTAFDRSPSGELSNQRTYAELVPASPDVPVSAPDGICLDSEGAVWVADPVGCRVLRVLPGGTVTDIIGYSRDVPVACALGGVDRRTLYICAAHAWQKEKLAGTRTGRIDQVAVTVGGAGKP